MSGGPLINMNGECQKLVLKYIIPKNERNPLIEKEKKAS
jgi:hypothetical protein